MPFLILKVMSMCEDSMGDMLMLQSKLADVAPAVCISFQNPNVALASRSSDLSRGFDPSPVLPALPAKPRSCTLGSRPPKCRETKARNKPNQMHCFYQRTFFQLSLCLRDTTRRPSLVQHLKLLPAPAVLPNHMRASAERVGLSPYLACLLLGKEPRRNQR